MAKTLLRDENIRYHEKDLELVKTQMMNAEKFQVRFPACSIRFFPSFFRAMSMVLSTTPELLPCHKFSSVVNSLEVGGPLTTFSDLFRISGYTELNKLAETKQLWNKIQHCADQYEQFTT